MSDTKPHYVLTLSCPDARGNVRDVSDFLFNMNATIVAAAQYGDPVSEQFFLRMEFTSDGELPFASLDGFRESFITVADKFSMDWRIDDLAERTKVVLAVSRFGHCLNDILHRWKVGILPIDIVAVVSNHDDMRALVEWHELPYHHLPVTKETKREQEAQILQIMKEGGAELLLLARYMQILSNELCEEISGRAINIHHSFLPSFKGAKPYHQAHARGVKIIGATAHYVTSDLDEGPIIEQCVERIDHEYTIDELVQLGRDTECLAFARAIKWHSEHRVILNGNRTVVFR